MTRTAFADPVWLRGMAFEPTQTVPDAPPRTPPGPALVFRPMWDLDGTYLWLGATGAASFVDSQWDSTFGADASVVRVREQATLGVIGGTFGGSRWTVRGGGRVWLDAVAGSRVAGRMVGLSTGPIVEFSDTAHPRVGGSVGVWGFLGVTPFARVGIVTGLGGFAEIGVHIALPVIRR